MKEIFIQQDSDGYQPLNKDSDYFEEILKRFDNIDELKAYTFSEISMTLKVKN